MEDNSFGAELVLAAGFRALSVASQIGGVAFAIDAKDERAAGWYERFGAARLLDGPFKPILPLAVIADVVAIAEKSRRYGLERLLSQANMQATDLGCQCTPREAIRIRVWTDKHRHLTPSSRGSNVNLLTDVQRLLNTSLQQPTPSASTRK